MAYVWEADASASLARRLGAPPDKLGTSKGDGGCPDIWELDNGDIAVIGQDLTTAYRSRLPADAHVGEAERLVVIPRVTLLAAKADVPDVGLLDGLSAGEQLSLDTYEAELTRLRAVRGSRAWKLERRQYFREPYDASWRAFVRGDWDESLRLNEADREPLTEKWRMHSADEHTWMRVRIVEEPIVPYLQWELHALRLQAECGERIHVVSLEQVKPYETGGPLPELVVANPETIYQVIYNDGVYNGAVRYTAQAAAARIAEFLEHLYSIGEDVRDFFERKVASLPPPPGE